MMIVLSGVGAVSLIVGITFLVRWISSRPKKNENGWYFGPIINLKNKSLYMNGKMESPPNAEFAFNFPNPNENAGHVHYVTKKIPRYKTQYARGIAMRFIIIKNKNCKFVPVEDGRAIDAPATLSMFLKRKDDNFSGQGEYLNYRWWSLASINLNTVPSTEQEVRIFFNQSWINVNGRDTLKHFANHVDFIEALANANEVGITLGHPAGRGHGVFATARARFHMTSFHFIY